MATSITNQFVFGQKAITTAGTQLQLDATEYALKSLLIIAYSSNTGRVFYGGSDVANTTQKGLLAGESIVIEVRENASFLLSSIWLDVSVNGEGADFIGVLA